MAAPTAAVDVCNLALDLLRQDAITSIETPTGGNDVTCARWYDHTRRGTLRKHPWNFAIQRATIAPNVVAPAFGYAYAYDLPSDFLRLLSIGDDYLNDIETKYQLENGQLLYSASDTGSIKVRYIYDIVNVAQFDPLFIDVLAAELALRMAYKITGTDEAGVRIAEHLKLIAPESYAIDGQERPPQRIQRSKFLDARRRGTGTRVAGQYTVFD